MLDLQQNPEMQAGWAWKGWSRLIEVKQKDGTQLVLVDVDPSLHTQAAPAGTDPRPVVSASPVDTDLLV